MNIYNASKLLNYIVLSKHRNGHGIHSPFVFDLVTRVFRNNINSDFVYDIEKIRKEKLSDHRTINVNDLGSGSERMNNNRRRISEIVRHSAVPRKYGILLSALSGEFGHPSIVELGTSVGISTMYMAAGSPLSDVFTVEGCAETSDVARENFKKAGLKNITLINGSFEDVLRDFRYSFGNPGLVFIDGNHRKQPMIDYFGTLSEISGENTIMVFDDIYYSEETASAWEQIRHDDKVTLSVDLFRMGLIFFRQGIARSDYIIRY